jgi:isoquinoline 1-oxidoreductase
MKHAGQLDRRTFLAGLGGTGLVFAFDLGCRRKEEPSSEISPDERSEARLIDAAINAKMDYRGWLVISPDGKVTAHTGRIELGQGLKTVIYNVVCQALELPQEQVRVGMGDTALCPDDGPTTGSSGTRVVGWGYWLACHAVRAELLKMASSVLEQPVEGLVYRTGEIFVRRSPERKVTIDELGEGVRWLEGETLESAAKDAPPYVDVATPSVEAESIVTGTKVFTGDLMTGKCLYGAFLRSDYHEPITHLASVDLDSARDTPDLVRLERFADSVAAVGRTFSSVRKALAAVKPTWSDPTYPPEVDHEQVIRNGRQSAGIIQKRRRVKRAFRQAAKVITESYVTQYASPAPIETHTAVADVSAREAQVWVGTQNPFFALRRTADALQLPPGDVRVVGMPPGGGFGEKAGNNISVLAAHLSRIAGEPVKYVFTRREQFQAGAAYKAAVVFDVSTALTADGELLGRAIDIHQDLGKGTRKMYRIPHVLTRRFRTPLAVHRKIMRGTSFTQSVFALESHTDSVAHAVGIDPVEFRRRNVYTPEFRPLLDRCAEMIGYGIYQLPAERGIGFGICHHGRDQLGVVGAEVEVDRASGKVRVVRLTGAFDIGVVLNRNTATMGIKGAMIWGLGYALFEEVRLDAHRAHTESFSDYQLPRFSDVPEIEIDFLDNRVPGFPRGCGEMPLPPTTAAICNAVYDAIGVRIYRLPMTPKRVKAALERA